MNKWDKLIHWLGRSADVEDLIVTPEQATFKCPSNRLYAFITSCAIAGYVHIEEDGTLTVKQYG